MAQDFKDMANSMPDGEAKDAWNDLANSFEQAKNEAAAGNDEEAIDTATGALDKAEQDFQDFIGSLENMGQTNDSVNDMFEQAQGSISGQKPTDKEESSDSSSSDKNESSENQDQSGENSDQSGEQESEQGKGETSEEDSENQEKPEGEGEGESQPDMEEPSQGDGGSGDSDTESDAFIPGLGSSVLEELIKDGAIDGEYDKMFGRDLTDEERQAIENYLQSLKGNG